MPDEKRTVRRSPGGAYLDVGSTVEHREHSIAVPAIFDLVEADFIGHGDAATVGVVCSLGIEFYVLAPFKPIALIRDLQRESRGTDPDLAAATPMLELRSLPWPTRTSSGKGVRLEC